VIDWDVEKALNLLRVQVHGQDTVRASGDEEIGHELGGDGDAGLIFAVLAGIAVKGQDGGDASRAGTPHSIDHDEHFHQMMIRGRAGGLADKDVFAADVLLDFYERFTIRKRLDGGFSEFDSDIGANGLGKRPVGCAAKDLHKASSSVDVLQNENPPG
jgi:hypothetical protein